MHIPDGFLDSKMSAGMMGAAAIVLGLCLAKVRQALTAPVPQRAFAFVGKATTNISEGSKRALTSFGQNQIYKMGMAAGLIFAAQMFNFPINGGTSGHLIGGVFAAVILGPFAGTIVVSVVLIIQSLFYADGGLFALGANIINMAVIASLLSYYIYYFLKKVLPEVIAIASAAWLSVVMAAAACACEVAFSGTIPLGIILPKMLSIHAVIGAAEALITIVLVNIFRSQLPQAKDE